MECWGENWVYPLKHSLPFFIFPLWTVISFPGRCLWKPTLTWKQPALSLFNGAVLSCMPTVLSHLTLVSLPLYISVSVSLPLLLPLRQHWFQQGRKWNCIAPRLPAGEGGDLGRVRGRGLPSKRSPLRVFFFFFPSLKGMKRLTVWECERGAGRPGSAGRKPRGLRMTSRRENIFAEAFWLTAGLN